MLSRFSAQQIRIGLASLSSQISFTEDMDSICNNRPRVINISLNDLYTNKF